MRARDIEIGSVVWVDRGPITWIGTVVDVVKTRYGTDVEVTRPQRWVDLGIFKTTSPRSIHFVIDATDASLYWPWIGRDVAPELETIKSERCAALARERVAASIGGAS